MNQLVCSECGANLTGTDKTCRMILDEMVLWDFEDYLEAGHVHLLTLLCYNLQHPSLYSRNGLEYGKGILVNTLAGDLATPDDRARRDAITSALDMRTLTIGASPEDTAAYIYPVAWSVTVSDVAAGGSQGYADRVRAWGRSIFTVLKETGNI